MGTDVFFLVTSSSRPIRAPWPIGHASRQFAAISRLRVVEQVTLRRARAARASKTTAREKWTPNFINTATLFIKLFNFRRHPGGDSWLRGIDHPPNVPILVECALDEIREADDGLFGWERINVSNDNTDPGTAAGFGVETLLSDQFATVLDSAD